MFDPAAWFHAPSAFVQLVQSQDASQNYPQVTLHDGTRCVWLLSHMHAHGVRHTVLCTPHPHHGQCQSSIMVCTTPGTAWFR